ncbi:MAG: flagellar hook-basal body complex protein FliE [Pyrinomonadaceae bacterium]
MAIQFPTTFSDPVAANSSTGLKYAAKGAGSFADTVKDAVASVEATQQSAEQQVADAVSGKSPDLHKTIIALQTADLKFQLGLQVRNKLIGAYEEIMRMQV